jgi:hypothetical protein
MKPGVVYGSETWALTVMDMKRLSRRERKTLRRIHGSVVEQGIWRKRTDQELYRDPDIVADMKKKRLEWIGHVVRM